MSDLLDDVLATHFMIGAALTLACAGAIVQLCGCMRVTCRELAVVSKSWGTAIAAGLVDAGLTIASAAEQLGVSRQYIERLLRGVAQTIPLGHLLALSNLAGVDPAAHTTPRTTWPKRSEANPPPRPRPARST